MVQPSQELSSAGSQDLTGTWLLHDCFRGFCSVLPQRLKARSPTHAPQLNARPPAIAQPEHPGLSSSSCRRGGTDGPATLLESPPLSYPYQSSSSCSESTWQGQGRSLWSPVRTRPSQSSSNTFHTGGLRRVLRCFPPFSSMTSRRGSPLAAESSAPDWAPHLGIQIWASLSCCPGLGIPVWVWGARGACGVGGSLPAQPPSLPATAEGPAASGEPPFRNPARTLEASQPPQACALSSFPASAPDAPEALSPRAAGPRVLVPRLHASPFKAALHRLGTQAPGMQGALP